MDETNEMLEDINSFIDQYDGTAIGYSVKNMLENGTNLESICDYADIPYYAE